MICISLHINHLLRLQSKKVIWNILHFWLRLLIKLQNTMAMTNYQIILTRLTRLNISHFLDFNFCFHVNLAKTHLRIWLMCQIPCTRLLKLKTYINVCICHIHIHHCSCMCSEVKWRKIYWRLVKQWSNYIFNLKHWIIIRVLNLGYDTYYLFNHLYQFVLILLYVCSVWAWHLQ